MLNELRKKLNADDVIVPPVPRKDFWTDENHFNLQEDPLESFAGAELLGRLPSKKRILLHFVKKQSLHSRNPCAVKLQSGINGSVTPAVLWTDFIPFAA